jgi:hypothetical protein
MRVKDLIKLLEDINPEAEVIIKKDVESHGYDRLMNISFGIFEETDYGNDFYPGDTLIVSPTEVQALCLEPLD